MSRRARLCAMLTAVCLLGAAAAVLSAFRVSLDPPALRARATQFSVAKAELLVDKQPSFLVDGTNDWELPLPGRAALTDAMFLQSDAVRAAAADAAGISGREVAVSGPFTDWLQPSTIPTSPSPAPGPIRVDTNYRLLVDVAQFEPTITLYGQAPSTRAALAIVENARSMLIQHVAELEATTPVPSQFRVALRPLGPPTGGVVDPTGQAQLIAAVFLVVVLLGGGLVLAADRSHRPRSPVPALDPLADPGAGDDWPNTHRLLPWSIAGFLVMLFLVPIDALSLPVHLPLDSTPDRALLIAIALLWLATLAAASGAARPRVTLTGPHVAVFAFVGLCCVGVALNARALTNAQEVVPVLKKLVLLASFVVFFVIVASVIRPREVPRLMRLIVILGVIVAIGTIIERESRYNVFYAIWRGVLSEQPPPGIDQVDAIGRLTVVGPTNQPLELATLLAMALPFALVQALASRTRRQRLLYMLAATVILGGAISTYRKTSLVVPVAGVLTLVVYRPRVMLRGLAVALVPMLLAVHILVPGQLGTVYNELLPGSVNKVGTTTNRVARYDAVRPDIMSHLLLGRGYLSYDPFKYRVLDNQYLGLLICVGVIGVLVYLAIFFGFLAIAHPTIRGPDPRRAHAALAAQAAIVMFLVSNALFDVLSFRHDSYFALFIGALVLALRERSPDAAPALPAWRTTASAALGAVAVPHAEAPAAAGIPC